MRYSFNVSTKIQFQEKRLLGEELLSVVREKNCLFLTSASMISRLELGNLVSILQNSCELQLIQYSVVNPTETDIKNILSEVKEKPDVIIALGGGSILDLAKAISAFSYLIGEIPTEDEISRSIKKKEYFEQKSSIPIIAIPTTSGTGSEVTRWATIWNYHCNEKMSIEAEQLLPTYAYIIPEFTCHLPARQTLSTGLDALMHAVESYWAVSSNALVRELAKTAISLIVDYLPITLENPNRVDYREKLCLGSLLAGLAFSNTRTTACHSISYPLTMNYGVEHGFAAAVTLTEMIKFNQDDIVDFSLFLQAFRADSVDDIESWLDRVSDPIQPCKLREFGIKQEDIKDIVEKSFTLGRMDNNPRQCTKEDVKTILESLL